MEISLIVSCMPYKKIFTRSDVWSLSLDTVPTEEVSVKRKNGLHRDLFHVPVFSSSNSFLNIKINLKAAAQLFALFPPWKGNCHFQLFQNVNSVKQPCYNPATMHSLFWVALELPLTPAHFPVITDNYTTQNKMKHNRLFQSCRNKVCPETDLPVWRWEEVCMELHRHDELLSNSFW